MSYFKNKNIWFWAFLVLLVLNLSVVGSMMYHGYKMRQEHPDFRMRDGASRKSMESYLAHRLDLSEEQQEQLKEMRTKNHKVMRGNLQKLTNKELELFTLHSAGGDSASIAICLEELDELNRERSMQMLEFYASLRVICTPEQYPKLDEMITQMIMFRSRGPKGPGDHRGHRHRRGKHHRNGNQ